MGTTSQPSTKVPIGLTKNVLFSPLEANADTRLAATQADDAKVDPIIWALPNETIEQSKDCEVLRCFAASGGLTIFPGRLGNCGI